jgi:hypothetical protein
MPYVTRIDDELRLMIATVHGAVTKAEFLAYQADAVRTRPGLRGYSELIDVTRIERLTFQVSSYLPLFADQWARLDPPGEDAGCLLIVAPDDFHFGLGRMYQAHRELHPESRRKVRVFRTIDEAMTWLAAERASKRTVAPALEGEGCLAPEPPLI